MIDAVRIERDGPVTTVLLSRARRRNAVDGPTAAALADVFREFDSDPRSLAEVRDGLERFRAGEGRHGSSA